MSPADASSPGGADRARPGRLSGLRSVNLAVRLLCELVLLVALAVWGFHTGAGAAAKVALGLGRRCWPR
jgi:hypothetical protein